MVVGARPVCGGRLQGRWGYIVLPSKPWQEEVSQGVGEVQRPRQMGEGRKGISKSPHLQGPSLETAQGGRGRGKAEGGRRPRQENRQAGGR